MATANTLNTLAQEDFALAVKTRLLERRQTVTHLASDLGYARNTVSIAINHPSMLPSVKRAIRRYLGL